MNFIKISTYSYSYQKRIFDIFFSIVFLIFFLVILPPIALSARLIYRHPVLFKQTRVGLNLNKFTLYKFMTMKPRDNSEAMQCKPPITYPGKILRKMHLDEIPQVINVFKGDMSIIGPRPFIPEETSELLGKIDHFNKRYLVKPGITGLAQINYEHLNQETRARTKLEHDLNYVQNCSLIMDFKILMQTLTHAIKLGGD